MDVAVSKSAAACLIAVLVLSGCKSKQAEAVDTAKQAAAATGQAKQVVTVDKNGTTTTTVVAPPVPGRAGQAVTTTVTPGVMAAPVAANTPATVPVAGVQAGAPMPVAGGGPVIRPMDLTIASGTSLMVRINQQISVKSTRAGDRFDGEIVEPIVDASGREVVGKGTSVSGVVDASHRRGHFKGSSLLELRLVSMTLGGQQYRLETRDLARSKKGKGKRSAAFIGGGTGLGMLIGGVATGGVGLLVGGLAGAGAGTAAAGLTGNRDLDIAAESIVRFKLAEDLVVQP